MFDENGSFSEDTFKENLQNSYFPVRYQEKVKKLINDMLMICLIS